MANEITIQTGMILSNGLLKVNPNQTNTKFNQTTARGGGPGVVDIGTTEETISFGDIVPGFVRCTNLDATNFVTLRFSSGVNGPVLRANSGIALFEMPSGGTLRAIADTASCRILVEAFNL